MRNAVIYGCGQQGRDNFRFLQEQFNVLAYTDSNPNIWGGGVNGLPIVPPSAVAQLIGDNGIVIISFVSKYGDVMRWCEENQLDYVLCINEYLYDEKHAASIDGGVMEFSCDYSSAAPHPVQAVQDYSFENALKALEVKAPAAYAVWRGLVERMELVTLEMPLHNMSFKGHPVAYAFRQFLTKYLHGTVLDVGCGISGKPEYLAGYPDELLAGIDPLPPLPGKAHPFCFSQGTCECLPFAPDSFDAVVMGTSFDHLLLPYKGLTEVRRVLRDGGLLLVWEVFINTPFYYDPYGEDITSYDPDHLFHLTKDGFEGMMIAHGFSLADHATAHERGCTRPEQISHFYALKIHK